MQNCQGRRGPLSAERGILTALTCTGSVPECSCPPAKHLLLRLQVHFSLFVLSLHLPLTPSASQHLHSASWARRLVKLQTSREDSKDKFSRVCLAVPVPVSQHVLSLHYRIPFSWHVTPCSFSTVPGPAFLTAGLTLGSTHCFSLWWLISCPSSLLAFWTPLHFGLFSLHFALFNSSVHLAVATF